MADRFDPDDETQAALAAGAPEPPGGGLPPLARRLIRTSAGLAGVAIFFAVLFAYVAYSNFRIEVPKDHVAVLIRRTGRNLPNGAVIAPDETHKGVQLKVLQAGRYYYNPYDWDWRIVKEITVPEGKVGVLTRLFGKNLDPGQVLADDDSPGNERKGIVKRELMPGRYVEFSNPFAYAVELRDAVNIPPGFRGVVTVVSGDKWAAKPNQLLVGPGERGVQEETLPPGIQYNNPFYKRVSLIDCRQKTLSLAEDQDMGFPSKDGFWVRLDGFVRFRVLEKFASRVFVLYNEDGNGDEVTDEVKDKVILPYARSLCRNAGSRFSGREMIDGGTREQFQKEFERSMREACTPLGIEIEAASITEIYPPQPIMEQLTRRGIAEEQRKQYLQEIDEQKSQAKLAREKMLKEQQTKLIQAEQATVQAKTKAEQIRAVAKTKAEEQLAVADQRLKAAKDQAATVLNKGEAEAKLVMARNEASVSGFRAAVTAFDGNGFLYAQHILLEKLAPKYRDIMASSTEGPFAKLFETQTRAGQVSPRHDSGPPAKAKGQGPVAANREGAK